MGCFSARAVASTGIFFPSYASVALARSSHSVCADERIRQCMSKHPTLGSRKWSADHYAVQSPLQGAIERENQQRTKPKTKKRKGHPVKDVLRRGELGMILHKATQTKQTTQQDRSEGAVASTGNEKKEIHPPCKVHLLVHNATNFLFFQNSLTCICKNNHVLFA